MTSAPVAFFVYNRPSHTRDTLAALAANDGAAQTDLLVFSDGPRDASQISAVREVRQVVAGATGFRSLTVIERDRNLGLSRSVISGVNQALTKAGRLIVLEDDLQTSPYFLRYMNEGLALYESESKVAGIHAYLPPVKEVLPHTFFLRGADCWGWATWERAWAEFNPDARYLLNEIERRGLESAFDLSDSYPYTQMLRNQVSGRVDSWAIRWHASAFLADMLTLHPGRSLVRNIGLEGSGTHGKNDSRLSGSVHAGPIVLERVPIEPCLDAERAFRRFFGNSRSRGSLLRRFLARLT